jgi:hypothetical protein
VVVSVVAQYTSEKVRCFGGTYHVRLLGSNRNLSKNSVWSRRQAYDSVTIDGFCIGNHIYCTLTDPWLQVIITVSLIHALYSLLEHTVFSACCVFTCLLVTASNGGSPPSSGFRNCPRPQLQQLSANLPQLTDSIDCLAYNISARTAQKTPFLHCCRTVAWRISLVRAQPSAQTAQNITFLCCCLRDVAL